MGWQSLAQAARVGGIDWTAVADDSAAKRADPYLFWATLTGFGTYQPADEAGLRRAAFALDESTNPGKFLAAVDAENLQRWHAGQPAVLLLARHYRRALQQASGESFRFFVAKVDLDVFEAGPLAAQVHSYRVSLVGDVEGQAGQPTPAPPAAAAAVDLRALAKPVRKKSASTKRPVIGIIDTACAFAHPRLSRAAAAGRPAWSTRISHLWDMGREAQAAGDVLWSAVPDFGYGRETDAARLDALIALAASAQGAAAAATATATATATAKVGNAAAERRCYEAAGLPELLSRQRRWSHGTVVADFAAGACPKDRDRDRACACADEQLCAQASNSDAAADADIIFVQLPADAVADLSCGWLSASVIDALNYIVHKAAGRPLVCNLSFGGYAGPHDGESLLERALDALARDANGRLSLVLSAGNGRLVGRLPSPAKGIGLHAGMRLGAQGRAGAQKSFRWYLPPNDSTQSFLEIWYAAAATSTAATTAAPPDLEVTLQHDDAPGMAPLRGPGGQWFTPAQLPARPVASVLHVPGTHAGGEHGLMLLALGPTDREVTLPEWGLARAPSGYWTVTLRNCGRTPVDVNAWVQRDDPDLSARSQAAQSHLFEMPAGVASAKVGDEYTLTALACGLETLVVGSRVERDPNPTQLALDSSVGPARRGGRQGPDLLAAGVRRAQIGLVGIEAAANLSGGAQVRVSGTSIAAPKVARLIYNEWAEAAGGGMKGFRRSSLKRWFGPPSSPVKGAPKPVTKKDREGGRGVLDDDGRPPSTLAPTRPLTSAAAARPSTASRPARR